MNEQNETFGAKLTVFIGEFKNKLKEASKYVKAFGEGVKENFDEQLNKSLNDFGDIGKKIFGRKEKIETEDLFDTGYANQIEYVKAQMQEIKDLLDLNEQSGLHLTDKEVLKLKADYEKLYYQLQELEEAQEQFNNGVDDMGKKGSKTTSMLSNLFDSSIGKIKRFTFYLLGARSVFSLFMKYQSIYYQYNEKMQYQSELSQNAIALSLAPAFEFLGNVIAYVSIGFAKFIELLTGVNVLSKVSTKGIRDYNKSLKETQSLVSGVDEITNLNMPTGTGLASQYQALNDFQEKVAEVEKFFKENEWIESLANGLKKLWEYIKIGYEYIKDHWDVFKYIFGAVAITLALSHPIGQITLLVASIGLLVDSFDKLKSSKDKNKTATDKLYDSEKKLKNLYDKKKTVEKEYIDAVDEHTEAQKNLKNLLDKYKINIKDLVNENGKAIKSYDKMTNKEKEVYKAYLRLGNATDDLSDKALKYKDVVINISSEEMKHKGSLIELDKKYDETFNNLAERYRKGEIDAKTFTASVATYMEGMSKDYRKTFIYDLPDDLKGAWKIAEDEIGNGLKVSQAFADGTSIKFKEFYSSVKTTTVKIGDMLDDTFKDRIFKISAKYNIDKNSVLNLVNKVKGISTLMGVPTSTFDNMANKILKTFGYAKGLDYVPYDEYPALLHKGEAVVPAKYNPTIHSTGNEYTNSLLETLIVKIDDLSKRPNEFNIDGQKFASATYPLYEEARTRQNYVEGVVVR